MVLSDRALRSLARLREAHNERSESRAPSPPGELAERTGLHPDQVDNLMATERPVRSLEESMRGEDVFGGLIAEGENERVLAALEAEELQALLGGLSNASARSCAPATGSTARRRACGRWAGVSAWSGERVRQIEQRALGKLATG